LGEIWKKSQAQDVIQLRNEPVTEPREHPAISSFFEAQWVSTCSDRLTGRTSLCVPPMSEDGYEQIRSP
jgi:hypothetical protein